MSRPFAYRIFFDVSHETEGSAAGYFRMTGNYGGMIVVKIGQTKSVPAEAIAHLLAHEAVHMFSHLQRTVRERIGAEEAIVVPGETAARILDISSFAAYQKTFMAHFAAIRTFLNSQPHRSNKFDEIPESTVAEWTRKVVEETIAYIYESRVSLAADKVGTAGSKGPTVNMGRVSFVPLSFLKNYMTTHWLTNADDQKAMGSKQGEALLDAMSGDMINLHQAVEAQVGPDKGS
jgi:hypothetical protein